MNYKINPNIHSILPQHTGEEMMTLKTSIAERGVIEPAIIWRGHNIIVDGHARIAIAEELGLHCPVVEMDFANETEVILWVIKTHLGRRNLSLFQRCELALKYRDAIAAEAWKRQMAGRLLSEGSLRGRTDQILGNMAGVSSETMRMARYLMSRGDQETLRRLRKGEISISHAYRTVANKPKRHVSEYSGEKLCFVREALADLRDRVSKGEVSPRAIVEELDRISGLTLDI